MRRKNCLLITAAILLLSLTGCTIGSYSIMEVYTDENGDERFMLFGQHGAMKDENYIEEEISSDIEGIDEIEGMDSEEAKETEVKELNDEMDIFKPFYI